MLFPMSKLIWYHNVLVFGGILNCCAHYKRQNAFSQEIAFLTVVITCLIFDLESVRKEIEHSDKLYLVESSCDSFLTYNRRSVTRALSIDLIVITCNLSIQTFIHLRNDNQSKITLLVCLILCKQFQFACECVIIFNAVIETEDNVQKSLTCVEGITVT